MMLTLRRLTGDDVEALRVNPDEVVPLLRDVDGFAATMALSNQNAMEQALAAVGRDVWTRYVESPEVYTPVVAATLVDFLKSSAPPQVSKAEYLDLDKSWHILHTLISGSPDICEAPEASLLGGEPLGPCGGYGPVRLLLPEEVSAFADILEPLDADTLKKRAEPAALQQQGVTFAQTDFDLDMIELEIEDYFPHLKKFVAQTVKKKRALLLILE